MRRNRKIKIIATLGPASDNARVIRELCKAGVDVFRLNMSHGNHAQVKAEHATIRRLEQELNRPIGIMADLQGPKLRVGRFRSGQANLKQGARFRLDLSQDLGTAKRASLPHPEIFAALKKGARLLLDDGRICLRVEKSGKTFADTVVEVGGKLSNNKGVNIPNVVLPLPSLTEKDKTDLEFALDLGMDWIGLSFIQRPNDLRAARKAVAGRAAIIAKLEKPSAIHQLANIIELADAVMVARGDLGVELPLEEVPAIQKRIVVAARRAGKPVIIATQMLESMIHAPVPTRAEVSDVATAVFDGADAVMLSAESAAGEYPVEAVETMNRIAEQIEKDVLYRPGIEAQQVEPDPTSADALCAAARQVASTLNASAIVNFTSSGSTALRSARQRPETQVMALTPEMATARRLALAWGLYCVHTEDVIGFTDMVSKACAIAREEGFAKVGGKIVVTAGVPFGTPGKTNILRVAQVGRG